MHRSTPTTNPIDVDGSQELHRYGAEVARGAHNSEVTGSKPVAGIYHSQIYKNLPRCHHSTLFHRRGAEVARAAHNCKDIRSKRIAGIFQFADLQESAPLSLQQPLTGMAQRERAGLITPRSLVRIQLPVFIIRSFIRSCNAVTTATLHRYGAEVARGAHNSEVTGSKPVAGIYHSPALSEAATLSLQQHFTPLAHQKSAGLITLR